MIFGDLSGRDGLGRRDHPCAYLVEWCARRRSSWWHRSVLRPADRGASQRRGRGAVTCGFSDRFVDDFRFDEIVGCAFEYVAERNQGVHAQSLRR